MKVVAVFAVLFVAALAAPTEVENAPEKVIAPAKEEKPVEQPEAVVSPSSDAENLGKVESAKVVVEEKKSADAEKVVEKKEEDKKEEEVKVEDKVEPAEAAPAVVAKDALSVEETAPVPVAVAPEEEAKPVEEAAEDDEDEKKKKMEESSAICRASTGATLEQITAISDKPEDDAPKEVKCYVKCIDEQLGIVKDQVVQDVAALAADPSKSTTEESETAVDDCGSLETDDPCDSSYLRYSCYFRTTGKKIQIV